MTSIFHGLSGSRQLCHASGSQARYRARSIGAVSTCNYQQARADSLWDTISPGYGEWGEGRVAEKLSGREEEYLTMWNFSYLLKKKNTLDIFIEYF